MAVGIELVHGDCLRCLYDGKKQAMHTFFLNSFGV